jgi:hypothetical protein
MNAPKVTPLEKSLCLLNLSHTVLTAAAMVANGNGEAAVVETTESCIEIITAAREIAEVAPSEGEAVSVIEQARNKARVLIAALLQTCPRWYVPLLDMGVFHVPGDVPAESRKALFH